MQEKIQASASWRRDYVAIEKREKDVCYFRGWDVGRRRRPGTLQTRIWRGERAAGILIIAKEGGKKEKKGDALYFHAERVSKREEWVLPGFRVRRCLDGGGKRVWA